MGRENNWIIELNKIRPVDEPRVGGKAARLALMAQAHYRVPDGFCLTVEAYEHFIERAGLDRIVRLELERKSLDKMRWEELWDTALRIRTAFNSSPLPSMILDQLRVAVNKFPASTVFAVRSSAPGEDSSHFSFAGLHESFIGVSGLENIADSVRLVWASLWSDAALLYRKEMGLNPGNSKMAVVIQIQFLGRISGVAFGRDPRDIGRQQAVVEAVPGLCADLVDGKVDPDRWILHRPSGRVLDWRAGQRSGPGRPLLSGNQLQNLYRSLTGVEKLCGWEADAEWTMKNDRFVFLQARPITKPRGQRKDQRSWYLSLRPKEERLRDLRERITKRLIPQLRSEGQRLADEDLDPLNDLELARNILGRQRTLRRWKKIYWDEFIPFAHGVRFLGLAYNDAVKPKDPYEFVGLFPEGATLASKRNAKLLDLARMARLHSNIGRGLRLCSRAASEKFASAWNRFSKSLRKTEAGSKFETIFNELLKVDFDLTYGSEPIRDKPEVLLNIILRMARSRTETRDRRRFVNCRKKQARLERKFFKAFGRTRKARACEILETARLSWSLRDDDNVLLGRVESQLIRALQVAMHRLIRNGKCGRTQKTRIEDASEIARALRKKNYRCRFQRSATSKPAPRPRGWIMEKPRQLIGQPVSPGLAAGKVHRIKNTEDMVSFQKGEILVCDAIQPSVTHLVPLANAVVERRGGMLMHGAIVARELGRPCVNGIPNAMEILKDGEQVTVDGSLGIVTLGEPEFDLENA